MFKMFKQNTVLKVQLDNQEICKVRANEVPLELLPTVRIESENPQLGFADSHGKRYVHDLSSVRSNGFSWLHFSFRINDTFTVEADCLINNSSSDPAQEFNKGNAKGIRFQPFYLPECNADPNELIGRGLFFRGLHFAGIITPGNVSLSCVCDYCDKSFRLQSFHAGFSNLVYFYCSEGPHTLVVSSNIQDGPPVLGKADPPSLIKFEGRLPSCKKCGGNFRYYNPLLCPHCSKPYIDFQRHSPEREIEYYGNYLYGDSLQKWDP